MAIKKGEELSRLFGTHKYEEKEEFLTKLKQSKLPKHFILGEGETIQEQIKNGKLN